MLGRWARLGREPIETLYTASGRSFEGDVSFLALGHVRILDLLPSLSGTAGTETRSSRQVRFQNVLLAEMRHFSRQELAYDMSIFRIYSLPGPGTKNHVLRASGFLVLLTHV